MEEALTAVVEWDTLKSLDEDPCFERGVDLLVQVRSAIAALRRAESELANFVYDISSGPGPYTVEGIGAVTVRAGYQRTAWDKDELIKDSIVRLAGKLGYDVGPIEQVVRAWLDIASPTWKLGSEEKGTGLRGLGLDADEYSTKTLGPPRVTIQ